MKGTDKGGRFMRIMQDMRRLPGKQDSKVENDNLPLSRRNLGPGNTMSRTASRHFEGTVAEKVQTARKH